MNYVDIQKNKLDNIGDVIVSRVYSVELSEESIETILTALRHIHGQLINHNDRERCELIQKYLIEELING